MNQRNIAAIALAALLMGGAARSSDAETLSINAAGTLAMPFHAIDAAFEKANPGVTVEPQFGGSVMMAKRITDLHQPADILAVADYSVIPKYLFPQAGQSSQGQSSAGQNTQTATASWYVGFARNAITFVYTAKSEGAGTINSRNWYEVMAGPGVEIGRSNPDTDPSGYQTLQMLDLAAKYYKAPDLAQRILANAPQGNIRDTETDLISALQLGQIDYLAIYRSDGLQHHLQILDLPPQINLGDPALAVQYATAVAHTKNGDVAGKPIVYAATIPSTAPHAALAARYIAFLLGPEGQAIIAQEGFGVMKPPLIDNPDSAPKAVSALAKPWPRS